MRKKIQLISVLLISTAISGGAVYAESATKPDNSKVNEQDKNHLNTAGDQSNDTAALENTRKIRDAITDDKSLSTYAHNIKIITEGSTVFLKGPVRTANEKRRVGEIAAKEANHFKVKNELTVTAN